MDRSASRRDTAHPTTERKVATTPRSVYRVVTADPPAETDFYSPERQGRRLRPPITPELLRSFRSVSVWDTLEGAQQVARDFPKLGRYVAVLELSPHIAPERFGAPGHWDVQAEPTELLGLVVQVVRTG